jgi:transposase
MWLENTGSSSADVVAMGQRYGGPMLVRYRYRAYPTSGQAVLLARVFGCPCVVFNDALRPRDKARAAGVRISDTAVQRAVVTIARTRPHRVWRGEVASVALVQVGQDPRRTYGNFSLLEEKAGRCHRRVVRVSRWFPCIQLCSARGLSAGRKPLDVRSWTCPSRGIGRDRGLFAAKNIPAHGREVGAGLAENRNARGGSRGPGLSWQPPMKAEPTRGAA